MRGIFILTLSLAAVLAVPTRKSQKIVGGSITNISEYPYATAMLRSIYMITYSQICGGTIITNTAILSAAHCYEGGDHQKWRIRVGSTFANSGGTVYSLRLITNHPDYISKDNDVSVLRTETPITFIPNTVAAATIADEDYNLADNQIVWAIGWGSTSFRGSEQLRHVQVWTINQDTCRSRYAEDSATITDNMLCSGWLDVGGRDQCQGDSGGPLIHNNVIVGICSWGNGCALDRYPGVNTRVSRYSSWIHNATTA